MSTVQSSVSDLTVTVKSREIQRGMLAELAGDKARAATHFLAAAHLELVLADDFAQAGQDDMVRRSRLSAASCFWRAGQVESANTLFDTLIQDDPGHAAAIQEVLAELQHDYPQSSSPSVPPEMA